MSDARTTPTDAAATLGMLINPAVQKRDAIHLATEPVFAGAKLYPGQDIGLGTDGKAYPEGVVYGITKPLGIVDPFLKLPVMPGEAFWLIVYPRQITTLRHTWEHPDFPAVAEKVLEPLQVTSLIKPETDIQRAVKVLEGTAEEYGITYAELLADAQYSEGEDYFHSAGKYVGGLYSDFWEAYTTVTGKEVNIGGYDDGCRGC
jgi:hypothetical protein